MAWMLPFSSQRPRQTLLINHFFTELRNSCIILHDSLWECTLSLGVNIDMKPYYLCHALQLVLIFSLSVFSHLYIQFNIDLLQKCLINYMVTLNRSLVPPRLRDVSEVENPIPLVHSSFFVPVPLCSTIHINGLNQGKEDLKPHKEPMSYAFKSQGQKDTRNIFKCSKTLNHTPMCPDN